MSLQISSEEVEQPKDSPLLDRRGRFIISRELIRTSAHKLAPLFSRMVILEAQVRWENDAIEYLALSEVFEVVPEGVSTTKYEIQFEHINGEAVMGNVSKSKYQ